MKRNGLHLAASAGSAIMILLLSSTAWAQVAPPLGAAERFGALARDGVTGAAGAGVVVSGDVGSSPTPTIINFGPSSAPAPFVIHRANDGVVQQARIDAIAAYNNLVAQGPGVVLADNLAVAGALTTGIYSFATGTPDLPAGATLTLNGGGVFIFNVGASLTFNVNSVVAGTADPCLIFWRVNTDATLNGVNFRGTVIAGRSITLGSSSSVSGRLLAGTGASGAITMAGAGGNTVGGCSTAAAGCPVITVSPATAANGTVGAAYSQTFTAAGGTAPYTFTTDASTLPAGLSLSAAGVLSGTPTTAIPQTFDILATDNVGCLGNRGYTVSIAASGTPPPAGCPVITLAPTTLPNTTVGVAYSQTITASGGTSPYAYTVTSGGPPPGLTLATSGVLSGTPTSSGTYDFTVRGTDASLCFAELRYSLSNFISVPTLPQIFVMLLAVGLLSFGYLRLRRRTNQPAT